MHYDITSFELLNQMLAALEDDLSKPWDTYPCIEWPRKRGPLPKDHYGYLRLPNGGKVVKAHRTAYAIFRGEIPDGLFVCHHCDNPPCFRPVHLFLGTDGENIRDSVAKGRYSLSRPKGESHHKVTITNEQINKIRQLHAEGWQQRPLAKSFECSQSTIWRIIHGLTRSQG